MADTDTSGDNRRVLVVDDNADVAGALGDLLDLQGCHVRIAHGGEAGLEVASEFRPRLAFLDIGLPGMSGYEMAGKLREVIGDQPLTLVALTGLDQPSDRQKAREAGFDHHLVKPAQLDQIRDILDQI